MKQNILHTIGLAIILSFLLLLSGCGNSNTDNKINGSVPNTTTQVADVQDQVNSNIANVTDDVNTTEPVTVFKADAGEDQTVIFEREFIFDGSKSTGDIVSYEWVFGDHVLNANETNSPTYARFATQPAGVYTVTLKATNSEGQTSSDDVIITVIDPMPTEISVDQLKVLMKMGVTYIDVRHEQEWADITPIEGSQLISYENYDISPWLQDGSKFLNIIKDKNQEFVLICKAGARAKASSEELMDAGYTNVHWLSGGILAWNESK